MIRPKEKDEKQSILDYLEYFKRIMRVNHWTNEESGEIFCALLGPNDRSTDSLEGQWTTFSELEELLRSKETPMRDANLTSLMNLSMHDNETVEALRDRTVRLVSLVYSHFSKEVQSQIARDFFLHAIPQDVLLQVLTVSPKTLEDTVSITKSCLMIQKKQELVVAACNGQSFRDAKDDQQNSNKQQASGKRKKNNWMSEIQCHRCKGIGHIARNCTSKPMASVEDEVSSPPENF